MSKGTKTSQKEAAAKKSQTKPMADWLVKGLEFEKKGDVAAAEEVYKAQLSKNPQDYDAMCAWTDLACKLRQYETAMMMANQAMKMAPERSEAVVLLGVAIFMQGKSEVAKSCFNQALEQDANNAKALYYLALLARDVDKDKEKAVEFAERAQKIDDELPELLNLLGNLYAETGKLAKALPLLRKALEYGVEAARIHSNIGDIYNEITKFERAAEHFEKASKLEPESFDYAIKACVAYANAQWVEPMHEFAQKALEINPKSIQALTHIVSYWVSKNNYENVKKCVDEALKVFPNCLPLYYSLTRVKKVTKEAEPYLEKMKKLSKSSALSDKDKLVLGYALGKAYDDLKEYDEAFHYYKFGAKHHEKPSKELIDQHLKMVDWIENNLDREFFEARKDLGTKDRAPIFILGTPRSGTTLVEQILSSHSKISATGELAYMPEVASKFLKVENGDEQEDLFATYPIKMEFIKKASVEADANAYLNRVFEKYGVKENFTDKLPHNYLYLGYIALLFPNAKVIHCRRHPLDACLSMFFQNFTLGHDYSFSQKTLVEYYQIYNRLMKQWQKILPLQIHDVCYEALLDDPEEKAKNLIAYCGVDWEQQCLEFYKNDRAVATASHAQVKQPIYKTSKQRWKNYKKHIQPMIKGLSGIVDEYERELMGK